MIGKLFPLVQFIPLSVFLSIIRWSDESGTNWQLSFIIGGCISFIETIILLVRKTRINRFILAVNLFLFVGGVSFIFKLHPILSLYKSLMQSALFASLILVGLVTTFFSSYGFIGIDHPNKRSIKGKSYSNILL